MLSVSGVFWGMCVVCCSGPWPLQMFTGLWLSTAVLCLNQISDIGSTLLLLAFVACQWCFQVLWSHWICKAWQRSIFKQPGCSSLLQQLCIKNVCIHVLQQINGRTAFILYWYTASDVCNGECQSDSLGFPLSCNLIQHVTSPQNTKTMSTVGCLWKIMLCLVPLLPLSLKSWFW